MQADPKKSEARGLEVEERAREGSTAHSEYACAIFQKLLK